MADTISIIHSDSTLNTGLFNILTVYPRVQSCYWKSKAYMCLPYGNTTVVIVTTKHVVTLIETVNERLLSVMHDEHG